MCMCIFMKKILIMDCKNKAVKRENDIHSDEWTYSSYVVKAKRGRIIYTTYYMYTAVY